MADYTEETVRAQLEKDGGELVSLGDGTYHVVNPDNPTGDVERVGKDGLPDSEGEPQVWTLDEVARWVGID